MLLYFLWDKASNTAFHLNIIDAKNYYDVKEALIKYFSPVESPEELRTKFHQRYQGPDGTLEHLRWNCAFFVSKLISPWDQIN